MTHENQKGHRKMMFGALAALAVLVVASSASAAEIGGTNASTSALATDVPAPATTGAGPTATDAVSGTHAVDAADSCDDASVDGSCCVPGTGGNGGSCTFVCNEEYLYVDINAADPDATVWIGAECSAKSGDSAKSADDWDAHCKGTNLCSGTGETTNSDGGNCKAAKKEFWSQNYVATCVNSSTSPSLILELLEDVTEAERTYLAGFPACAGDDALANCEFLFAATIEGGSGVLMNDRDGVLAALSCHQGLCQAI